MKTSIEAAITCACKPSALKRRHFIKMGIEAKITSFAVVLCIVCNMTLLCNTLATPGSSDCEFKAWCDWHNDPNNHKYYSWEPVSSEFKGDFLFLGAYLAHPIETGVKARLLGEEKSAAEKLCMSFMFFMVGKPMGSLRVLKTENGVETLLWEKTGDQGFKWHEGSVNITSKSPFKVIIESEKGAANYSGNGVARITFKDCAPKPTLEQKCGIKMKALGCFNDSISDRLFPDTLENEGHSGSKIDWQNYRHSMEEILCHCAEKTKEKGYKKFGFSCNADCWAGPASIAHERHGTSDRCMNDKYESCPFKDDAVCCGADNNHLVYELL